MLSSLLFTLVALERASAWVVQPTATGVATPTLSGSTQLPSSPTPVSSPNFPALGALPRKYSKSDFEQLWDVVGPVQAPPFTTTRVPQTPVALPSAPPALYPSWYSPAPKDLLPKYKFPKGFKFGVATAAYQVEGAVKDEGKGPTMWDWNSRQPGGVADNTTGDVVDLHYFLYKEDVARIAALGVNAHSFSVSWARVFPFGTADSPINQAGLDHYSDVIDYHLKLGVEPVVTLFHWDVPLALQAYYGGFTSPNIVDDFVHYAKTVFRAYNGRVKTWYTFNEPRVYCGQLKGYPFNVNFAPGVNATTAPFHCSYNLLKAHAGAVKAFREMKIQGEIGFKNDDYVGLAWRANSTEDAAAVERHAAFQIGVFSDPVYKSGDWPQIMKDTLPPDFLPRFTEAEKKDILGSADFYAIDPYRTQYVTAPSGGVDACVSNPSHGSWPFCNSIVQYDSNAGWSAGWTPDPQMDWLQATPSFLVDSLKELKRRWPYKKIYVAEFGFAEPTEGSRNDLYRIKEDFLRTNYFMTYLGEILRGIHEENLPIAGAFAWAMVDNTEWASGTSARFGIQYVNYTSLERHYKRSALALSEFWNAHN